MIGIPYQSGMVEVLTYDECVSLLPYLDYSNAFFNHVEAPIQVRQGFEYLDFLMNLSLYRPCTRRNIRRTHPIRAELDLRVATFDGVRYYIIGISPRMKAILLPNPYLNWDVLDNNFPIRQQSPEGLSLIKEMLPLLTRTYVSSILSNTVPATVLSQMLGYAWSTLFPTLFSNPTDLTPWNTLTTGVIAALAVGGPTPAVLRKLLSLPEVSA